jgi:threonine aldolase
MTLNRRQFLGSALPIVGASVGAASAQPAASASASAPATADDRLVLLAGDALPRDIAGEPARLQALLDKHARPGDRYLAQGAVAELETKFSALLGKEDTVFMPQLHMRRCP